MPTPAPTPHEPRPRLILILDDEPDIGASLRSALERRIPGVRVTTATRADQALRVLEREPVDLVLSDFKMPGMTGIEFLERARAVAPGAMRVMMTAFAEERLAIDAVNRAAVHHFLLKPFRLEEAVQVARDLLERRRGEERQGATLARAFAAAVRETPAEAAGTEAL